ncbi:DUF1189 domain-containing protein [Alkalihalobacillus oceani]|uniref:DUF1189 domain-containing protein n=1 Tax=Halalkalibacter oceani TaxID=1653776 RepID=UPI002040D3DE|nr:DUF1189 domain-containing protein [Halalkalibacter oceani]MCM3761461.1 DUF1189 domain-containing protein [Halalkalibacter oceani]
MSFWKWFMKCYDRKVVAYSRLRPITSTIWHVLFVMLLASLPFVLSTMISAVHNVGHLQETLQADLPDFQLINGQLSMEHQDVFITEHTNDYLFVIDPNHMYAKEDLAALQNGIVLQKQELIMIDGGHLQPVPYLLLGGQQLSGDQLKERIDDLAGFLPILLGVVSILMYAALAGTAFLGITVLAFIGLAFRRKRRFLTYRHLWLMTAHAFTYPVIILFWIDALLWKVPFSAFVLATFVYLLLAMNSIPLPKQKKRAIP